MILMFVMFLVLVVYLLFYFISYKLMYDMDSSAGYECGFSLISMNRMKFSYRFFLIGMLFLIFDIEIVLLLGIPFLMKNSMSIMIMIMFILILLLGLLYEFMMGSLEWVDNISKA